MRIGQHLDLIERAALHVHTREPRHRGQQRHDLKLRQVMQRVGAQALGAQRIGDDREYRRVHAPHAVGGTRGQLRTHLGDGRVDQQRGGDHVATPAEVHRDLRRAARGGRAHLAHARHRSNRLLDRSRHGQSSLVGRTIARGQVDHHARKGHLRKKTYRRRQRRDRPGQRQCAGDHDDRARVPLEQLFESHVPLASGCASRSRTGAPSLSW